MKYCSSAVQPSCYLLGDEGGGLAGEREVTLEELQVCRGGGAEQVGAGHIMNTFTYLKDQGSLWRGELEISAKFEVGQTGGLEIVMELIFPRGREGEWEVTLEELKVWCGRLMYENP
jgi:hypothetical protein